MKNKIILVALVVGLVNSIFAQTADEDLWGRTNGRLVTSAVPFLLFAPDARSSGMGDVGAATSPDANAMFWNASKLAFLETKSGASLSYSPWLRKLVNDMYLGYFSGYTKLSDQETVGLGLRYFNLGSMTFTDNEGEIVKTFEPKEFEVTGAYARKLSDNFSMSIGLKYIHSNLTGGYSNSGGSSKPGNAAAGDVSAFYTSDKFMVAGYPMKISAGASLANLGSKISYSEGGEGDFLPGNMRLGVTGEFEIDQYNKISLSIDANKLLVPTPPVYALDSNGQRIQDDGGGYVIESGKDPNRSYLNGVFGSFTDAPDGFSEEMSEFILNFGAEYWYGDLFAVRGGYFYESVLKGGRQYFTAGIGLKYQVLEINMSYLIPRGQASPLADTLRFSILVNIGDSKEAGSVTDGASN